MLTKFVGEAMVVSTLFRPHEASAAANSATSWIEDDIHMLKDGSDVLGTLLENWERATVDCTYADVPRELLEQKNKELLLEKASTFGFFDKSTSVVSCKTTTKTVRDYLGINGRGPLVGAEKRMIKLADVVDPDSLDDYFTETETFAQALARSSALSWFAKNDFEAINNFEKGSLVVREDSNLEQSILRAIIETKSALDAALKFLPATTT